MHLSDLEISQNDGADLMEVGEGDTHLVGMPVELSDRPVHFQDAFAYVKHYVLVPGSVTSYSPLPMFKTVLLPSVADASDQELDLVIEAELLVDQRSELILGGLHTQDCRVMFLESPHVLAV